MHLRRFLEWYSADMYLESIWKTGCQDKIWFVRLLLILTACWLSRWMLKPAFMPVVWGIWGGYCFQGGWLPYGKWRSIPFVKFRTIYSKILKKSLSEDIFKSLCDQFSNIVVDEVVAAPWVEGAREFLENNKNRSLFFIVSGTQQKSWEWPSCGGEEVLLLLYWMVTQGLNWYR